jgi:hypothetical protein
VQKPDFEEEVRSGDPRRGLAALRDLLAAELATKVGSGVASVARVLLDVIMQLEKLPKPRQHKSIEDELKEMREARRLTARGEVPVQRFGGREPEKFPRRRN